jgi:hypothetical protein
MCLRLPALSTLLDFGGGHLAVIVMVQIAVNAAFIAAVGDIEMNIHGHTQIQGPLAHFLHQGHAASIGAAEQALNGISETIKMPR